MKINLHHNFKKLILFSLSLWLVACHSDSGPQSIRFGLAVAPITLDPRFATDATSTRINRLLYRALVDFDAKLQPVPDLATWEQIEPTHYRFHLGQTGRQFHDGSRLTAKDVIATYEFILDEHQASPLRGSLTVIKQLTAVNEDTIDLWLKQPDTLLPGRLTVGIVPAALISKQHPLNKQPVGSGPFRLINWPHPSHLYVQRLSDQQRMEFLEVKDPVVRVLKLLRGEVDILQNDLSPELITWLGQRPEVKVTTGEGTTFSYLGFNLQDPLTSQLPIRQAMAYAINRPEIIHYLFGNAARLATSFLLPTTHWAGTKDRVKEYAYHPDQARALLAQLNYSPTQPLSLTYKISNNPLRIRIASVIQQQLAQVGIHLDLRTYDWGTFYGDIKEGRFQIFNLSWVGIKMPDIYRYAFHSKSIPPQGANRGRLHHSGIDNLIEQADSATTLAEQAISYQSLQQLLFQELPYIPLWYEDNVLVNRRQVEGYTLAPDGNYDGLNLVKIN